MPLSIKYDYRFDPFTEADQAIDISSEEKAVPSNTPYYVNLEEVPRQDSPSLITAYDVTGGLTLSEISGTPATGEFNVDYKYQTGKVRFNAAQAGNTIRFDYKGTGHIIAGTFINILSDWIGKSYTVENDHDHDGVNSKKIGFTDNLYRTGGDGEQSTSSVYDTFVTLLTYEKIYIPPGTTLLSVYISIKVGGAGGTTGYVRLKVGSDVGAYAYTSVNTYSEHLVTIENPDSGCQSVIIEGANSNGAQSTFVNGDNISNMVATK